MGSAHGGQTIDLFGITIHYKVTGSQTGGAWILCEWRIPPYWAGFPKHKHMHTLETWYVLGGTLACLLDDQMLTSTRDDCIVVPTGVSHTLFNPSATVGTLLVLYSPAGLEHYFEELAVASIKKGREVRGGVPRLGLPASQYDYIPLLHPEAVDRRDGQA